ncbi:hypothetical protein [Methylobacterium bullatum]|uniref:5'-methylthioadenosine/S-adenosylhomocysteine nucleosidase n=1 Tax=Methylobacterium bullatum TaxID=570505 RepID=A0AAV4Z9Q2_9HYPH|nr:hypothetical protein [Methylobacterium bullatum]MBD8902572.1 hypothetical protein [Methylobacterium bullatum]GJD40348.1 5'-methylthioadenosine/S-adenosylhomocysteine nucleosidase [Methylobacterium bullatum]
MSGKEDQQPDQVAIDFPNISGKWMIEIRWVRGEKSGRVDAEAFIRQEGTDIGMTVHSRGMDSNTISVQLGRDRSGVPILYYMYEVDPKAVYSDAPGPYKGAAILRYYPHIEEMSGNYWTSERSSGHFKLMRGRDAVSKKMDVTTDVLLITALKEEYDAARRAFDADGCGGEGVRDWRELDAATNLPHERGIFHRGGQALFSISIARASRMGGIATGPFAARLVEHLRPGCLVMSGVCAGNPGDVARGDVVISELAYQYDEGKREAGGFVGDHRQAAVSDHWLRAAESLQPEALPSYGKPSPEEARFWVLETLHAGSDPRKHPARSRYFGKGEWRPMINRLLADETIEVDGPSLRLRPAGEAEVQSSLILDVDPPEQLPFAIKVGPIASGNVVVKDGVTWEDLRAMGVRSVIGLEMEAAAIARVAVAAKVPEWLVVKGVMDHADPNKDDRYKPFAARASAEVLRAFLTGRFMSGSAGRDTSAPAGHSSSLDTSSPGDPIPAKAPTEPIVRR